MESTEKLYPMLLPDDEEGLSWSVVYKTKEEVIATLEMNDMKANEVSMKIIEYNQQYVEEFGLDAKSFNEATFLDIFEEYPSTCFVFFVPFCIFMAILIALLVTRIFDIFWGW